MRLTQTLLGFLHRVFNKDPAPFLAMQVNYAGTGMTWSVMDQVLTIVATGGAGAGTFSADLTQYTLRTLAAYLASLTGFSLPYLDQTRADLAAYVLLDAYGDQNTSNGDLLFGYTSLLYALQDANAAELATAEIQVANLPAQLNVNTGSGNWLDEIGGYYAVPRNPSETDPSYGPRIIAEVIQPKCNNVALQMALQTYTGQSVTVTDVQVWESVTNFYNGADSYNGAIEYSDSAIPSYGLFDVVVGYDLLNGGDPTSFLAQVTVVVGALRAAGTHMRAVALSGSQLADTLTSPTDAFGALIVGTALADTLTSPTDSMGTLAAGMAFADALTAPTDAVDSLTVTYSYSYDGTYSYDGSIDYVGGAITGAIAG